MSHKVFKGDPPPTTNRPETSSSSKESREVIQELTQKISDLISRDPEKAVKILTDWVHSTSSSSQKKKAG